VNDPRLERLLAVREAAKRIASPDDVAGRRARLELLATTGLSAEGIELVLGEYLELTAGRAALAQLLRRATPARRAHVLLSANVFSAAYRAIMLALLQSEDVHVRASRREPVLPTLLAELSRGAFTLEDSLSPEPGDHLWAYGTQETLKSVQDSLPSGVHFHGHGPGMGVAVVVQPDRMQDVDLNQAADGLALDTIAFDQRGCLSPRVVLVQGTEDFAADFSGRLARALSTWERAVPRGKLDDSEAADARRYEDTMIYVGGALRAGRGLVALDPVPERALVPPVGRYLHVTRTADPLARLLDWADRITCVGMWGTPLLAGLCEAKLGPRRYVPLGQMQKPPLDGPVDLRTGFDAEIS
jgi:hypothetical protein